MEKVGICAAYAGEGITKGVIVMLLKFAAVTLWELVRMRLGVVRLPLVIEVCMRALPSPSGI